VFVAYLFKEDSKNVPEISMRRAKTATGARAFGVVAPKVWHDLPDSVRSSDSIT